MPELWAEVERQRKKRRGEKIRLPAVRKKEERA